VGRARRGDAAPRPRAPGPRDRARRAALLAAAAPRLPDPGAARARDLELRHPRAAHRLMRDSALQRMLWGLLESAAPLLGPRVARAVAAAAMRLGARTPRGYAKGVYRVARRWPVPMPDLWKVPEPWWAKAPRVRAPPRRLRHDPAPRHR